MKHVAGHALRVHADQHVLLAGNVAFDKRDMLTTIDLILEGDQGEIAVPGGYARFRRTLDQPLVFEAIPNDLCDRDEFEVVLRSKIIELRAAGHAAVRVHDFADHTDRRQSREPRQINGCFRLPDPAQHTTRHGAQRKDMTGTA
jgi:hypothetical protein